MTIITGLSDRLLAETRRGDEKIPASHNAANRTLTAVLVHLTDFGVMQAGQHRLFLPALMD